MNSMKRAALAASVLVALAGAAAAQEVRRAPRDPAAGRMQAPPARLGFGADNDAQLGGVPGNAPFNNQLRKHTDPLGANGGR